MSKLFLVFGTPGAGKSTVLEGISSAKVICIGDEMMKFYSKKFGVKDRDYIGSNPIASYDFILATRNSILKKIAKMRGNIAIDTHASVKKGDSYTIGFSLRDFEILKRKVKSVLYIDADTEQIIARRNKDRSFRPSRERDTPRVIDRHRNMNIAFATLAAFYLEVPIYIVENDVGKLAGAQKRVDEIIRDAK